MADLGSARARAEEQPEQHKGGDDGSGVAASGHGHRELADGEADTYEHVIDRAQALRHQPGTREWGSPGPLFPSWTRSMCRPHEHSNAEAY